MVGSWVVRLLLMHVLFVGSLVAGNDHRLADAVENKDKESCRRPAERTCCCERRLRVTALRLYTGQLTWNDLETAGLLNSAGGKRQCSDRSGL